MSNLKFLLVGTLVGLLAAVYPQVFSFQSIKSIITGSELSTPWHAFQRFQDSQPIASNYDPESRDYTPPPEYLKSPAKKVTSAEPVQAVEEDEAPVFFVASDDSSILESSSAAIQQMIDDILQHSKSTSVVLIRGSSQSQSARILSRSETTTSAVKDRLQEAGISVSSPHESPSFTIGTSQSLSLATLELPSVLGKEPSLAVGKHLRMLRRSHQMTFIVLAPALSTNQNSRQLLDRTLTEYTGGDREIALNLLEPKTFVQPIGMTLLALTTKLAGRDEAHQLKASGDKTIVYRFGHAESSSEQVLLL